MTLSAAEWQRRHKGIVQGRQNGSSAIQIGAELDLKPSIIGGFAQRLVDRGEIPPAKRGPKQGSTCQKIQEVEQRLQNHPLPKDEIWLPLAEASRKAGITKIQLWYLKRKSHGHIKTRSHCTQKCQGKPVTLYAASQMEIVREVYKAYVQHN